MRDINLCISCSEIYGIVLKHVPSYDWQHDSMEVLIEDRIYHVYRTYNLDIDDIIEDPFFNVRIIKDET